jgi:hypothetical protein
MLEGSLDTFALPAVVRLVRDSGANGRLQVAAALGTGSLSFADGLIVDAQPSPGSDVLEGALSLFGHRTGTFSFRAEPVGDRRLDLEVEELLKLVDERDQAWARIREAIPGDGPLAVLPDRRREDPVGITAEAWRVAVLAGGRTPAQLAAACGLSEFKACTVLLELLDAGLLISVTAPGTPAAAAQAPQTTPKDNEPDPAARARRVVEAQPFEPETPLDGEVVAPDDSDVDPSLLLRELGGDAPPPPTGRRRR